MLSGSFSASSVLCSCSTLSSMDALMRKSREVLSFMYCIKFTCSTKAKPGAEHHGIRKELGEGTLLQPFSIGRELTGSGRNDFVHSPVVIEQGQTALS